MKLVWQDFCCWWLTHISHRWGRCWIVADSDVESNGILGLPGIELSRIIDTFHCLHRLYPVSFSLSLTRKNRTTGRCYYPSFICRHRIGRRSGNYYQNILEIKQKCFNRFAQRYGRALYDSYTVTSCPPSKKCLWKTLRPCERECFVDGKCYSPQNQYVQILGFWSNSMYWWAQ